MVSASGCLSMSKESVWSVSLLNSVVSVVCSGGLGRRRRIRGGVDSVGMGGLSAVGACRSSASSSESEISIISASSLACVSAHSCEIDWSLIVVSLSVGRCCSLSRTSLESVSLCGLGGCSSLLDASCVGVVLLFIGWIAALFHSRRFPMLELVANLVLLVEGWPEVARSRSAS